MAKIAFTPHLQAVGPVQPSHYAGETLAQVLDAVAADYPRLKGYVLDDQGRLRKHISVFIDGTMRPRPTVLGQPLTETSEVFVFQALSGG